MIDITKDIQPLTTFRNNSVKFMKRLKKTPRPIILTVNGKPEAVVQSAAEYQRSENPSQTVKRDELKLKMDKISRGRCRNKNAPTA